MAHRILLCFGLLFVLGAAQACSEDSTFDQPDQSDEDLRRRRRCGDGVCGFGETCASCLADCGSCPPSASADLASLPSDMASTAGSPDGGGTVGVGKIYGPGLALDSLANTTVDGGRAHTEKTSMRFRAEQSSPMTELVVYSLNALAGSGYGGGDGGICRFTLEKDAGNGHPDGTPIWTFDWSPVPNSGGTLINIPDTPTLVAGQIYHLCSQNVSPDPGTNYFALDYAYDIAAARGQETIDTQNGAPRFMDDKAPDGWPVFAHLMRYTSGGAWTVRQGFLPIISITYGNGAHQGMGYIEASYGDYTEVGKISGSSLMVRERFTVSGTNRSVTGAGFKIGRTQGTSQPLTVTLEDGSGNAIDSFSIPAASVPSGPDDPVASGGDLRLGGFTQWIEGVFSQSHTLQVGSTYNLRLSSTGTYFIWTNRSGAPNYHYSPATVFSDGNSQYTADGGSAWSYLGRNHEAGQHNLHMFMRTQ